MPIRADLKPLYPPEWPALSRHIRFEIAGGRCQDCSRPHLRYVLTMKDGRWFDPVDVVWRDAGGNQCSFPGWVEAIRTGRASRVVLATAHLDNNPANAAIENLRALCQWCHLRRDREFHLLRRWANFRSRLARADLFCGPYEQIAHPCFEPDTEQERFMPSYAGR